MSENQGDFWRSPERYDSATGLKKNMGGIERGFERAAEYVQWRRALNVPFNMDVDQIEWRKRNGVLVPVAIVEVTCMSPGRSFHAAYGAAIVNRIHGDGQGYQMRYLSDVLKVPAFITVYEHDLRQRDTLFANLQYWPKLGDEWVWEVIDGREYREWLRSL